MCRKPFPFHCFLECPCFMQFDSVFQPFKFIPKITLNFCLHSTCNINSKALLRATAGGRCEKLLCTCTYCTKLKNGWTELQSTSGLFRSTGFPQEKFLPLFLCFKLCIFPRGDSRKSFCHPRLNEELNDTSYRQEAVSKSGFLWSCSWIVFVANDRYYQCRDVEDGIKWRRLSLLLSNSFDRGFIFCVSSRRCIFHEYYCHRGR